MICVNFFGMMDSFEMLLRASEASEDFSMAEHKEELGKVDKEKIRIL